MNILRLSRSPGTEMISSIVFMYVLTATAQADICQVQGENYVRILIQHLEESEMLVTVCPYCEDTTPVPLRIHEYTLQHHAPAEVTLAFYDMTFPVAGLVQAEEHDTGPLATALHDVIEKEYADETGYLPNDPILQEEKKERYKMMLRFAREDVALRTWDEVIINGQTINPALLYYPAGDHQYRSLGAEINCDLYDNAPLLVNYIPVDRSPVHEKPPATYIADITGQCYDGSCPGKTWKVVRETAFYANPGSEQAGSIPETEILEPLQTLSYVTPGKAIAKSDKGRIFAGDIFYLLDSLGEGFYRYWHYGDIFIADTSGIRRPEGWNYCEEKNSCWADLLSQSQSTWWSKVKRSNGDVVWVKDPVLTLDGVLEE